MELTKKRVAKRLPARPKDSNKGTFGKVLVIAGSENFPGAAYLACAACYRVGAGLVTLATASSVKIIVSRKLPEITFLTFKEIFENLTKYDVLLFGPGLGQKSEVKELARKLIRNKLPKTIIDGDGLNLLSQIEEWWKKLSRGTILTPHPKEMSRLTGLPIDKILTGRFNVAQYSANKWDKIVVLKGANTLIVSSAGEVAISPFANPTLSTAGTGDVLAGAIAGFLAQGLTPFDASSVGVYIHGQAGEMLREKIGNTGSLASDLLPFLPLAIRHIQTTDRLN